MQVCFRPGFSGVAVLALAVLGSSTGCLATLEPVNAAPRSDAGPGLDSAAQDGTVAVDAGPGEDAGNATDGAAADTGPEDAGCPGPGCTDREDRPGTCADGFDNDGDGYVDCEDFGCAAVPRCLPTEDSNGTCADGVDNDGDLRTDCDDSLCALASVCEPTELSIEACQDDFDNDDDTAIDCADPDCAASPVCSLRRVRIATYNVQTLGYVGSVEYEAVRDRLARVSPEIVCLNEVESWEGPRLEALAVELGYAHLFRGRVSSSMAGGLTNVCLSRMGFSEAASLESSDISVDSNASEIGRDVVKVRFRLIPGLRSLAVYSVHLKSGFDDADYFRRQVESVRVAQAVAQHRLEHPDDAFVVMGDLNEEIDSAALGRTISSPPPGLPSAFALGSDLSFPFVYDPFATFGTAGLAPTEPTHEDSIDDFATRIPSGRRIDYIVYGGLNLEGDEVYNPCRDNGVDDPPAGQFLPKSGAPLTCASKESASDHRLVFADFSF